MNTIFALTDADMQPELQAYITEQVRLRTTELQHIINELTERNISLLNLQTEKNDWLQMLVHDLKNPLASISLAGTFLEKYWQRMSLPEFQKYTRTIQQNTMRLNTLISRVLSLGALESGCLDFSYDHINVAQILASIVSEYKGQAANKDIDLVLDVDSQNVFVIADRCAFLEIIDNLLSNAIKYSPFHSTVILRTRINAELRTVSIEFQDQGPGIKPEEFERLFTKFARLSAKPTGGEHSTGLGLAVVHKLITSMNGTITCKSNYGNGATFVAELPLSSPQQYLDAVDYTSPLSLTARPSLPPLAINGFDTVSYYTLGKPQQGHETISTVWQGKRWYFENENHKALFLERPERFMPKYNGYCALGMARHVAAEGNPESWAILNEELFFAYDDEVLEEWKARQHLFVSQADTFWKNQDFTPYHAAVK
ncbi:MAG: HAMP domain-containing histidine kinase [Candidatus Kapabacteria bacterium]|jgi:signal transduction histidine kinase|nr:HAMP domain-containing histidine kinase [Candidatus Kapabacteria bacterium]